MKAFLVGFIFLAAVGILAVLGVVLFPLLLVLEMLLRVALAVLFVCLCIWLLGKFIIFIWQRFKTYLT